MTDIGVADSILECELSCPVCLSTYKEPVSLSCGHCFCKKCITEALCHQRDEGRSYKCPMCKQHYQDFPSLHKNLQVSSIVDNYLAMQKKNESIPKKTNGIPCNDCLDYPSTAVKTCVSCEVSLCHKHVGRHIKKNHLLLEPTASVQERRCSKHDEPLKYHCEKDCSCICVTCYIAGSHKGHNVLTLKQAHQKKLATLSANTSVLSQNISALCKDIDDLHAGLAKIKENTVKISKPIEDVRDKIITLVKCQFEEILKAICDNQTLATSKVTEVMQQMEDAKATTEQALKEIQVMSKEPDDLLFIKHFNSSQALRQPGPRIKTMQVVDVEADKTMIENVNEETTDYIASISQHLKYMYNVLPQQLIWHGTQQNQKAVLPMKMKKSQKMNLMFRNTIYSHCSYTITVSHESKTLTAVYNSNYSPHDKNNAYRRQWYPSPCSSIQSPCSCKLPVVIQSLIFHDSSSSKVYCLVDVSKSNDWQVGVGVVKRMSKSTHYYDDYYDESQNMHTTIDTRYLRCNGNCLFFESSTSLSLVCSKVKKLKMELDFENKLLGFFDAGGETETPIIICKCDDIFNDDLIVGFNLLDGSISLI